jgi:hypothetical protein
MDSIFIGSGIHGHVIGAGDEFMASAEKVLAEDRAHATYAMHSLAW